MANLEEGCAVGNNGELKDARDIQWYHSADDAEPAQTEVEQGECGNTLMKFAF